MASIIVTQAAQLVEMLAKHCNQSHGLGSMSPSLYDTAWVSMIRSPCYQEDQWHFPLCFQRLMELQEEDGSWVSWASRADRILTTAAGLLAIRKHLKVSSAPTISPDLQTRSFRAQKALHRMLNEWEDHSYDQVGFEVLITRHLDYLTEEGIQLEFPMRLSLEALCNAKLTKIPPSLVETRPTTLLHSLEALVGIVDFNKMGHLLSAGSMLASPAATAAYLINASSWDSDAEAYIQAVLKSFKGVRTGLVPCAWPTTIFEVAWVGRPRFANLQLKFHSSL
jgi:hypothetical protein